MKKIFSAPLLSLLFLSACSSYEPTLPSSEGEEPKETFEPIRFHLIESPLTRTEISHLSHFEVNLLKDIYENTQGNVVYSPLSVLTTMTMLLNGGDQEACQEFIDLLGSPTSRTAQTDDLTMEKLNALCQTMMRELPLADNQCVFLSKNSVWHDPSIKLLPAFYDVITNSFDAEEILVHPSGRKSMELINTWINETTQGDISSFLSEPLDGVDLAFINALSFKGTWSDKFDKALTREMTFHNQTGTDSKIDFMETEEVVYGTVNDYYTGAQLEYGNGHFKLILFMPSEGSDLDQLFDEIQNGNILEPSSHLFKIALPKFESNFHKDLIDNLKNIGVKKAFEKGFFNTIDSPYPLFLQCFLHGAGFAVDEEGAQGSAATLGGEWYGSNGYHHERLETTVFNRPFIYLVEESLTGTVLFMGCVRNL